MKKFTFLLMLLCLLPIGLFAQSYALGDVNRNGTVDINDALLTARYSAGLSSTGFYQSQADVNCSGIVDINDALLIARYSAGALSKFPCSPTPTATPTPTPTPTPTVTGPVVTSGLPTPPGSASQPRPAGAQGGLSVINWAGFKGAVSYSFDDDNASQINNWSTLMNLKVPLTFYLWTNRSEASNNVWSQALAAGHELGNHTNSHQQSGTGSDVDSCTSFIKSKFNVTPYTMAAPYGNSSYVSLASSRFIINRGVNGGYMSPNDNTDPFNIYCHIPPANASANDLNGPTNTARSNGQWAVFCIHGFTGGVSDGAYNAFAISSLVSNVNTVKGYGDVWIDTVLNVGAYWRAQKMMKSVSPTTSGSDQTYRWTLPSNFPKGKFLRVTVTGGTLKQNGQVLNWDGHGYYEVALDAGQLTISP